MNAPFKIEEILADAVVGITDLKRNPAAVIEEARLRQVAILNRNKPVAYLISPEVWEHINDLLADTRLMRDAEAELGVDDADNVEVDLADYL
jgi:antitoxin StbD